MKWRIDNVFSLNSVTAHPETNYMVQMKKYPWSQWSNVQMFVTREEALVEIQVRKELERKSWPI